MLSSREFVFCFSLWSCISASAPCSDCWVSVYTNHRSCPDKSWWWYDLGGGRIKCYKVQHMSELAFNIDYLNILEHGCEGYIDICKKTHPKSVPALPYTSIHKKIIFAVWRAEGRWRLRIGVHIPCGKSQVADNLVYVTGEPYDDWGQIYYLRQIIGRFGPIFQDKRYLYTNSADSIEQFGACFSTQRILCEYDSQGYDRYKGDPNFDVAAWPAPDPNQQCPEGWGRHSVTNSGYNCYKLFKPELKSEVKWSCLFPEICRTLNDNAMPATVHNNKDKLILRGVEKKKNFAIGTYVPCKFEQFTDKSKFMSVDGKSIDTNLIDGFNGRFLLVTDDSKLQPTFDLEYVMCQIPYDNDGQPRSLHFHVSPCNYFPLRYESWKGFTIIDKSEFPNSGNKDLCKLRDPLSYIAPIDHFNKDFDQVLVADHVRDKKNLVICARYLNTYLEML